MNTKKPLIAISALTLLIIAALPSALAAMDPFSSLGGLLQSVVSVLFRFFNLSYLGLDLVENKVAFMRLMIWIISFAIFNVATRVALGGKGGGSGLMSVQGGQKLPVIISICLATISAVFIPASVLLAIGIQYSAVWAAILLMALFAGMLYVAYGMIKPEKAMGHIIRLAILFVCWMLLLNFTAVVDNPSYAPSMSNSDFTFNNTVLGFIWELLSAVVGILIIYEIIMIFKKSASASVGQTGTHLSNTARWVDNTKDGWNDLKDSFKAEEDLEKREEKDLSRIGIDENRESTAMDRYLNFGRKLHTLISSIIAHLERMKGEILAGTTNQKKFQDELSQIIKKMGNATTTFTQEDSSDEWAYQIVSDELKVVGDLFHLLDDHDTLVGNLIGDIQALPNENRHKKTLLKDAGELKAKVGKFKEEVRELANKCRLKAQKIYSSLSIVKSSLEGYHKEITKLKDLKGTNTATGIERAIDSVVKDLNEILNWMRDAEGFLSVAYTMNRDDKTKISNELNEAAKNIRNEHAMLRRLFDTIKTDTTE